MRTTRNKLRQTKKCIIISLFTLFMIGYSALEIRQYDNDSKEDILVVVEVLPSFILTYGEQTIFSGSPSGSPGDHNDFPSVVRAINGTLICGFSSGNEHSGDHNIYVTRSFDDGDSWTTPVNVRDGDGVKTADVELGLSPCGTVVLTNQRYTCTENNNGQWMYSRNNGSTWTDGGLIWDCHVHGIHGLKSVGGYLYASTNEHMPPDGIERNTSLLRIDDATINATGNWTHVSYIQPEHELDCQSGEWDFLPINDTHFIAIGQSRNPSDKVWFAESFDTGEYWTNWRNLNLTDNIPCLSDPTLGWLNEDENLILFTYRDRWQNGNGSAKGCNLDMVFSYDEGATWINRTVIHNYSTMPPNDGAYSGQAHYPEENKTFLIWYAGEYASETSCDILGMWIQDKLESSVK